MRKSRRVLLLRNKIRTPGRKGKEGGRRGGGKGAHSFEYRTEKKEKKGAGRHITPADF